MKAPQLPAAGANTTAVAAATVFPRIHAAETLLLAWDRVEENERGPGVDGVSLDDFELRLDEHLHTLQRDLRDHIYRPQPLLRASMPKADGGRRVLGIPTVRDRVAQSAAALVVTPILEREFEASSFGFRRRRSVPHAVAQVRRYYEEGYRMRAFWLASAKAFRTLTSSRSSRRGSRLRFRTARS
jgi:retron-type reverse transcriptase